MGGGGTQRCQGKQPQLPHQKTPPQPTTRGKPTHQPAQADRHTKRSPRPLTRVMMTEFHNVCRAHYPPSRTSMALMAYSTWNSRPSGEKVFTPRSYPLLPTGAKGGPHPCKQGSAMITLLQGRRVGGQGKPHTTADALHKTTIPTLSGTWPPRLSFLNEFGAKCAASMWTVDCGIFQFFLTLGPVL